MTPSLGGGGGNRTRVREGSVESFYTFSALVFYLATAPLSGKWRRGQPVIFTRRLRVSPSRYPDLASPLRIASGGPSGRRHGQLSRECVVVVAYCF